MDSSSGAFARDRNGCLVRLTKSQDLSHSKNGSRAMRQSRQNYAMLNELLKDEDFRKLTGKVLEM